METRFFLKSVRICGFDSFAEGEQIDLCRDYNVVLSGDDSLKKKLFSVMQWGMGYIEGHPTVLGNAEVELKFVSEGNDDISFKRSIDENEKLAYFVNGEKKSKDSFFHEFVEKVGGRNGPAFFPDGECAISAKKVVPKLQAFFATNDASVAASLKPAHLIGITEKDGILKISVLQSEN